jgi:hypothetical protein
VKKRGYPASPQGWNPGEPGEREIGHWEVEVKKTAAVGQSLYIFAERGLKKKWHASARIVHSFPFHSFV